LNQPTVKAHYNAIFPKCNPPPVLEFSSADEIYLVIDGTYFPNDICWVVYRNLHLKSTQLYRMTNGEYFEKIAEDL
jgi:hypothetical protein